MASITVNIPARAATPRAPSLAAALFARLLGWLQHHQTQREVEFSAAVRCSEAARVRRFASQVMNDDPRFAADLFAAADRHDRG